MYDQAGLRLPGMDGLENPVKRNDDIINFLRRQLQPELQRQKSAGHGSRHRNFCSSQLSPAKSFFGHDHRPVTISHARPARQQGILPADIRISMNADRRNIQLASGGPLVEGLDVLQNVLELKALGGNQILGQGIEHESIIGIGRMP